MLLRPRGPTADVLRIFIKTDGPYNESSKEEQLVEVDFLISGKSRHYTSTQSWEGWTGPTTFGFGEYVQYIMQSLT